MLYLHNARILPDILTYFRKGMTLSSQPEPDLSIFIDVPFDIAYSRRMKRDEGLKIELDRESRPLCNYVECYPEFWDIVEENIPYFRRVDGTQSIEDVTESIMVLIPS